jgi:outer membrane protein assembly factor BamB
MRKISTSVDLVGGAGRVVVFEPEASSRQDQNLVCFDPDGQVRWKAELPTSDPADCFVEVRLERSLVVANCFSGYLIRIDPASGRTLQTQFTK